MVKVNVRNKYLKVIQLLIDEGYLTDSFIKVTTDICVRQALNNLAKQTGETCLDPAGLLDELCEKIY